MTESKELAIVPRTITEVQSLAEILAKSTLLPESLRNKVPDVVVSILAGAELGLSPMAAIRGVHVVQGKPILSADTMVGLVLRSGLAEYFIQIEADGTKATFETKRKGSPQAQRCTWTIDDAKRAAVNTKDNWRMYPRAMLSARARAELARSVYPDVLAGVYDPNEEAVPVREKSAPTLVNDAVDAEVVEVSEFDVSRIDAATTLEELKLLVPELTKLKGDSRAAAKSRYDERKKALEVAA